MIRLKKTVHILLIISLLLQIIILDSCDATKEKVEAPGETPYKIIWYHINAPQKDTEIVLNEVNKYLRNKINATLDLRLIDWQNYDKKINAVISAGEPFDICFTSAYINNYIQNSVNGNFLELDSLLNKYGQGTIKNLNPLFFEGTRIDGKIYAVPANKELAHQNALVFNKKYVDKYGFDVSKIKSFYDIEPMLKVIKEKEPDIIPYAIHNAYNNSYSLPFDKIIENIPGALYYDNRTNYKIINQFETPEYKKYFSTMHNWYLKGYIPKEAARLKQVNSYENSGNFFASTYSYSPHSDITLKIMFGYDCIVIPLEMPVIETRDCQGSMLAISRTSKNPQKVMEFINLLNTDEYLHNLIVLGIEGRHYTKNTANTYSYLPGYNQSNSLYMLAPFTAGNIYIGYIYSEYPQSIYNDYKTFNESAYKSPILGFVFDTTSVKKEISALASISSELYGPLITGTVDPDIYLPKAIEKYKEAGLDKVLSEEQRQLNEWLKKQ